MRNKRILIDLAICFIVTGLVYLFNLMIGSDNFDADRVFLAAFIASMYGRILDVLDKVEKNQKQD